MWLSLYASGEQYSSKGKDFGYSSNCFVKEEQFWGCVIVKFSYLLFAGPHLKLFTMSNLWLFSSWWRNHGRLDGGWFKSQYHVSFLWQFISAFFKHRNQRSSATWTVITLFEFSSVLNAHNCGVGFVCLDKYQAFTFPAVIFWSPALLQKTCSSHHFL